MSDYSIERLGHRGEGIADGPVYVARALPGEVVTGEVIDNRIAAPKIVTPSVDRVRAPCAHYNRCGACAVQHARDGFVADWKISVVAAALAGQGLEAEIRGVETSPPQSRRRAALSGTRTKKGALVGFHGRGSEAITPVPDCMVLRPEILAALPDLERLVRLGASRKDEVTLTVTIADGGLDVAVRGGKPLDGPMRIDLAGLVTQTGFARLTWDDEVIAMARPPGQVFDGIRVVPPPGAFLQATVEGEAALRSAVSEAVGGAKSVVDLFAGCGTFALPLARGAEIHAVEGDAYMITALVRGWREAQGLKRVTSEARDLFRRPLLKDEFKRFEAVVIDPPRAGAQAQVAEIAAAQVPRIAFVSCNPATFARDVKVLVAAGYVLNWIDVVDQFRWSAHVELAASLTLGHIG